MLDTDNFSPWSFRHAPIIVKDHKLFLGDVILHLKTSSTRAADEAIDKDVVLVLVWEEEKRIITGADILGRLLKGVTTPEELLD